MNKRGYVPRVLKKANCRDPRRASRETRGGVRQRNPANGQHRDRDREANFGEPLKPLRSAECRFRWRGKDGAKKKIIRAATRRRSRNIQRVTGNATQEILA